MEVLEKSFIKGFIRMIDDGWNQGWHECHGGNLSYRIKEEEIVSIKEYLVTDRAWISLGISLAELAGEYFLVTASGSFFRNATIKPKENFGIIELDEQGKKYRIVWGLENEGKPTSELPAHLMNHQVKKCVSKGNCRVVYHAHPANVISLSFVMPLEDITFTRELWEMEPECAMTFPEGMGVLPWMVPGTKEIAKKTCELMQEYNVVLWAQHGLFAAGDTFDNTFGLMHTVEKASEMLVKVKSMNLEKIQVASVHDFREMAKEFHLNLPEKFLYEK